MAELRPGNDSPIRTLRAQITDTVEKRVTHKPKPYNFEVSLSRAAGPVVHRVEHARCDQPHSHLLPSIVTNRPTRPGNWGTPRDPGVGRFPPTFRIIDDMNGSIQRTLRRLTQVTRPLAMRSAGTEQSNTSVVCHVGRRSGRSYETPVVVAAQGERFLIALPYGERTDWAKNVLASGAARVLTHGHMKVDQPQVIPMTDATRYFGAKEQKLHRRFAVGTCLQVNRIAQ